jgi:hypothetical protein
MPFKHHSKRVKSKVVPLLMGSKREGMVFRKDERKLQGIDCGADDVLSVVLQRYY